MNPPPPFCPSFLRQKDSLTWEGSYLSVRTSKFASFYERKYVKALKGTTFCFLEELNNLNLGGDAYLTLFTLIGTHSVAFIDGNKLKNERKCTPRIEKKTKNVCDIQKIDIMVGKRGFIHGSSYGVTRILLIHTTIYSHRFHLENSSL